MTACTATVSYNKSRAQQPEHLRCPDSALPLCHPPQNTLKGQTSVLLARALNLYHCFQCNKFGENGVGHDSCSKLTGGKRIIFFVFQACWKPPAQAKFPSQFKEY